MTEAEIERAICQFRFAARQVREAGFRTQSPPAKRINAAHGRRRSEADKVWALRKLMKMAGLSRPYEEQ
jgi:hypothetical protein